MAATVLMPSIVAAQSPNRNSKLDGALEHAGGNAKDRLPVIIQIVPGGDSAVRGRLAALGRKISGEFRNIGAVGANVNRAELAALVADPAVAHLSLDAGVHAHALTGADSLMTLDLVRADLGSVSKGVTGNGVGIAIIDSGINGGIPDIAKQVAAFYDFTQGGKAVQAYDDYGHGTHIAATIASSGQQNFYLYQGIAPKARLIGLKVLDKNGAGATSTVLAALQFATANKTALGIDVINLSLGHPIYESAATDPLVLAVEAAVRSGIVVTQRGLHPDLASPHLDGADRYIVRPQVEGAAARQIEARVVPVAGKDAVVDAAAIERKAHVRTAIVEGKHASPVVDDEDRTMVPVHDEPTLLLQLIEASRQREFLVRHIHEHTRFIRGCKS